MNPTKPKTGVTEGCFEGFKGGLAEEQRGRYDGFWEGYPRSGLWWTSRSLRGDRAEVR